MTRKTLFAFTLVACFSAHANDAAKPVARIFERQISAKEIGLDFDAQGCPVLPDHEATCVITHPVAELQQIILREIQREFIAANNLQATDEEIQEMRVFLEKSITQSRIRQQEDIEKLERQLAENHLPDPERERLESKLATLQRRAERDKLENNMSELTAEIVRMIYAPWIETFKFHQAIYEKFGGSVSSTKFGHDPIGAKQSLAEKLEKEGKLEIAEPVLREEFWKRLRRPSRYEVKKDKIDFTPFWMDAPPSR